MTELQVEATGETVGEAKWAALRELEKKQPGLDKSAVRFQVVTEGERGLLGVGFAPAKVIATVSADAAPKEVAEPVDESGARRRSAGACDPHRGRSRVNAHIDVAESDDAITVSCSGWTSGCSSAATARRSMRSSTSRTPSCGDVIPRIAKEVVVDAAGYRDRRRVTLESLAVRSAERALSDHEPVDLEPMTAIERKVVHLRLKEFDGVETTSEGTEPNRYVVVHPL